MSIGLVRIVTQSSLSIEVLFGGCGCHGSTLRQSSGTTEVMSPRARLLFVHQIGLVVALPFPNECPSKTDRVVPGFVKDCSVPR